MNEISFRLLYIITPIFYHSSQCDEACTCTAWENDGICTKTCGTGAQRQKRTCGTPPNSGTGAGCDTEMQDIACNTQEVSLHETDDPAAVKYLYNIVSGGPK